MFIHPESRDVWLRLRHSNVSSTQSSALFGCNPYCTAFELAVIAKAPLDLEQDIGERGTWGLRLQEAIAKGFSEDYGIKIRAMNGYAVRQESKMGASFDYEIVGEVGDAGSEQLRQLYRQYGAGVFEIKNVDSLVYKNQWAEGPPPHIELQVQHQLHCAERSWAAIGVLVGGNRAEILIRQYDQEVGYLIESKVREFWALLESGKMPPVDLPTDAAVIRKLYGYADPGKVLDAQKDQEIEALCIDYTMAQRAVSEAKKRQDSAVAGLLMKIGDAEKVLASGFSISSGMIGPVHVEAHDRAGYRQCRVYQKKEKTQK